MLLLNYWAKIWKLNYNQSRAGWTENNKDKKLRALTKRTKKIVRTIFFVCIIILSGQKDIYHQVEFCPGGFTL